MNEHAFSLLPFPAPAIPHITITGKISRRNNILALSYSLTGKIKEICLPSRAAQPGRKGELWKSTCFEFFLAIKDQPGYWEFNMSPSGNWNVYRMDAYRRIGFGEETSIQRLPFEMQNTVNALTVEASVDLNSLLQPNDALEIGITAVIQTKDSNETYWALTHPAPQADFHLRDSFILSLAAQTHPLEQSAPGG